MPENLPASLMQVFWNGNSPPTSSGLSGVLPATIGQLVKLQYLYLYGTKLSGVIPAGIENLVLLRNLLLSGTKLTGTRGNPLSLTRTCRLSCHYVPTSFVSASSRT